MVCSSLWQGNEPVEPLWYFRCWKSFLSFQSNMYEA